MAYIKVKWRKDIPKKREMSAQDYEEYLLKDRGTDLVVEGHNCIQGQTIDSFKQMQALTGNNVARGGKGLNIAFEVIHSFSPEESKTLDPQEVNLMGTKLAEKYFPDHDFLVVTHTDTHKTHNHILVNPVNSKTKKRDILDKKEHLYNLRSISDEIAREHGLSVIRETQKDKNKKLPQKVREIQRRGGQSYRLDLFQKADFARAYATSFDEYVGILSELSVNVAITDKNITYFYVGYNKGVRGNKLGKHYDKKGLVQKFKENDSLFLKQPQLRSKIRDRITNYQNGKGDSLGVSSSLLLGGGTAQGLKGKNYEAYTKSNRRGDRTPIPTDHDLRHSIIPISEIRKASNSDILEYCNRHKIKTITNDKGKTVLKGREHIIINDNRWTNTKNKTTGSLIEFVTAHNSTSYLRAISQITDNKNLLLLEKYMGEVKRPYTSFYIPKQKQEKVDLAKLKLKKFLKHHGINEKVSENLFKLKKVQVDAKGSIWFYPEGTDKEAIEFSPESNGYKSKRHGDKTAPFNSSYKNEKNVTIFSNFLSFLKLKGSKALDPRKSKGELVLMGLEEKALHIFLASNPNIKGIDIVEDNSKSLQKNQWNFIDKLKKDLKPYGITVNQVSFEQALKKKRSLDFDF
ncbi:MAG: relaxase/mobilization nuclease domain-containing protein [Oligoflexia bacterium]|nr:relaxase/mobilization nuclease domain-containing protein [Oligoflexia bacterium]